MSVLDKLFSQNPMSCVLLSIAIILFSGFIVTRFTKLLSLPNVTAYILAGILIGPSLAHLIPDRITSSMGFVSDIALAFIAFGIGKFFKKEKIVSAGVKAVIITVAESILVFIGVSAVMLLFGFGIKISMLFGIVAVGVSPSSTMMTIKQYNAKGKLVDTLLEVIALCNILCLFAFSVCSAIVSVSGAVKIIDILKPLLYNLGAIAIGALLGFVLPPLLMNKKRSRDNRLIIIIGALCALSGLCAVVDISPLLCCMVFGAVYLNMTHDKELYVQIDNFTPPIFSLFFILSGMNLNLKSLISVGIIGIAFFAVRAIALFAGSLLGCKIGRCPEMGKQLGFTLYPCASVAIGLAVLGERILGGTQGAEFMTIVLSASVLFELVGPALSKFALARAGAITPEALKNGALPIKESYIVSDDIITDSELELLSKTVAEEHQLGIAMTYSKDSEKEDIDTKV